eukprot:4490720-Prymnesium_polylepis.1
MRSAVPTTLPLALVATITVALSRSAVPSRAVTRLSRASSALSSTRWPMKPTAPSSVTNWVGERTAQTAS